MLNSLNNIFYISVSIILLSLIIIFNINLNLINLSFDSLTFINETSKEYSHFVFKQNFHVIFLKLLKDNSLNFYYYYFLNIFFFSASLLLLFQITDSLFDKKKINQIFIVKISIIIFSLFLPSMYFFYTQLGKELIIIFSSIYLVKFFFIEQFNRKITSNIFYYFILFLIVFILSTSKDYFFISLNLFYFFYGILTFKFSKNIIPFRKFLIVFIFFLLGIFFQYFIQNSLNLSNAIEYVKNFSELSLFQDFEHSNKNIFDKLVLPFNQIRYFLIQHSLINDAGSLISQYTPNNFIDSIKLFIITIPQGIFFPNQYFDNEISFLYKIASIENFIYLFLLSSFIFNIKNIHHIYLLIYFIILFALLLYLNPNIGSFYKQKSTFMYVLLPFGIINWIKVFEKINFKYFAKLNNTISDNEISRISSDSFKMFILIVFMSFLIIFRDYIVFIYIDDYYFLKFYFSLIVFLGVISTSINIPLNETINSFLIKRKTFNYFTLIKLIIFFYFLSIFLFTFFNNYLDINKILIIFYLTIFFASIFINSLFTNYFIINNKSLFIYFAQIIATLISIIYILFNLDNLSNYVIFISLNILVLATIILNYFFTKNFIQFFIDNFKFYKKSDTDLNQKFFINIFMNLSLILLLFFIFLDNDNSNRVYSIRFYLYFFTIFIIIFNFILNPFLNKNYQNKKNEKTILHFFNFAILISMIFVLLVIVSVDLLLINFLNNTSKYSIELTNNIKILFLGIPIHITNYFITKSLVIDRKYKNIFLIYLYSNIFFCFLIYLSHYLSFNIIISYLIIIFLQFIFLNLFSKGHSGFIIEKYNIFSILILFLIYYLHFRSLIDDYYFLMALFFIIIQIKLNFYNKNYKIE